MDIAPTIRAILLASLDAWTLSVLSRTKKDTALYLEAIKLFLFVHILNNVVLLGLSFKYLRTNTYAVSYWGFHLVTFGATLYIIICLWYAGLDYCPGFRKLGIDVVLAAAPVLLGFVAFVAFQTPGVSAPNQWLNMFFTQVSRFLYFFVAGMLFTFFGFLSIFQAQVPRTVRNLGASVFLYSISRALMQTWGYSFKQLHGAIFEWAWAFCTLAMVFSWSRILARHKSDDRGGVPPLFGSGTREALLMELEIMNRRLVRLFG